MLPIAPLLLVGAFLVLGVYGSDMHDGAFGAEQGRTRRLTRLLVAALFAWAVGLLTSISGVEQLVLWALFVMIDVAARGAVAPIVHGLDDPERWVLVGDDLTARRLQGFAPLRPYASVVGSLPPPADTGLTKGAARAQALGVVEQFRADRVVIAGEHADDEVLLDLVRAFKSSGVSVSLMPRPLDLLEAPAVTPRQFGGVPLIEIDGLASREAVPYTGPERRSDRSIRLSIVIPTKNEERNIPLVLHRLPADVHEVILADANSTDATVEVARSAYPGIRVLTQKGRGKGDALRTGFAAVTGTVVVMLDADGSTDPAEIPRFVGALEAGADFAKGSRFIEDGGSADITTTRRLGNAVLSGSANLLHGTEFTDLCYGYNAFWARCLPFISLDVPGFEVETVINLRIAAAGLRITEVPSYEFERTHGQSNLNTFRDGWRVLKTIVGETGRSRSIRNEARAGSEAGTAGEAAIAGEARRIAAWQSNSAA